MGIASFTRLPKHCRYLEQLKKLFPVGSMSIPVTIEPSIIDPAKRTDGIREVFVAWVITAVALHIIDRTPRRICIAAQEFEIGDKSPEVSRCRGMLRPWSKTPVHISGEFFDSPPRVLPLC